MFTSVARAIWLPLAVAGLLLLGSCGGGPGNGAASIGDGTLSFRNASDLGTLPLDVLEIRIQPAGTSNLSDNLLSEPIAPGGLVILGKYPAGLYDVVALVEGNFNAPFNDVLIRPDQPTTIHFEP